jgi:hypothetical protein
MRRRIGILFFPLLFPLSLATQESTPPRDPQALAILTKSFQLMARNMVLGQIGDMTVTADMVPQAQATQQVRSLKVYVKGLANVRWDVDGPDGTVTSIFVRGQAFGKGPDNRYLSLRGGIIEHGPIQFPGLYAGFLLMNSQMQIELGPEGSVVGRPAYVLRIANPPQGDGEVARILSHRSRIQLYIDKVSMLPLRLTSFIESDDDMRVTVPINLDFMDYRDLGGLLLPFRIVRKVAETPLEEIRIRSVTFNSGLADFLFQ